MRVAGSLAAALASVVGAALTAAPLLGFARMPAHWSGSHPHPAALTRPVPSTGSTLPADLFIRSVVTRDGALGWRQLCPSLQSQLSEEDVREAAAAQAASESGSGLELSSVFVAANPQPDGRQLRYYLLTARYKDGSTAERTYIVTTGPGGCVEDVKNV
jgi:hypothetical protein